MDLEVWEVIQVEGQACNLHSFDGRDILAEVEEICTSMDGIACERAAEAGQLSQLAMDILNALVDQGMLPIQDISQFSKSARGIDAGCPPPGMPMRGTNLWL
jgi:hypothetical protein